MGLRPILITGANGFVGRHLAAALSSKGIPFIASCRSIPEKDKAQYVLLDFCDEAQLAHVFYQYKPSVVVHCGAISQADNCETDQKKALEVNTHSLEKLMQYAGLSQAHFIFLSTDFVFDGSRSMHTESALPHPVNYYGHTKLLAEQALQRYPYDYSIIRTVLVYGHPLGGRENLVSLTKKKLEAGQIFHVVTDQYRTPTYVGDLVQAILQIITQKAKGLFHICGQEMMSPFEMAIQTAEYLALNSGLIQPILSETLSETAARPRLSGFCIDKAVHTIGYTPITFAEGLQKTFAFYKPPY